MFGSDSITKHNQFNENVGPLEVDCTSFSSVFNEKFHGLT
jgi:hypothetical protein